MVLRINDFRENDLIGSDESRCSDFSSKVEISLVKGLNCVVAVVVFTAAVEESFNKADSDDWLSCSAFDSSFEAVISCAFNETSSLFESILEI